MNQFTTTRRVRGWASSGVWAMRKRSPLGVGLFQSAGDLHRVDRAGLGARVTDALAVAPLVAELQRIERNLRQSDGLVFAVIE